jgi:hypothetical protein
MHPGPRGFMLREQCKRRSLRPMECRSHRTFSTMVGVSSTHRSDACRAGRCPHIPKVRSSSKSSRVGTECMIRPNRRGRIDSRDFFRRRWKCVAFPFAACGIRMAPIPRSRRRPTSPPRGGEVNSRSELGEGATRRTKRLHRRRLIPRDSPSPARLRERPLPVAGARWAVAWLGRAAPPLDLRM